MKKILYFIFALLFIIVLAGCTLVKLLNYKINQPQLGFNNINSAEEKVIRRKLDGVKVSSEAEANLYPVAVMVENNEEAWPLAGLDKANLVIEAITEADIPRFVAFFVNNEDINKIGPVRSARLYYLDWIEPYKPLYMHVGGSPEALSKLKSYDIVNLDQFFNDQYYWRDKWRYMPHNVYTSSDLIKQALTDKNLNQPADYETWQYKDDPVKDTLPDQVSDIIINYSQTYYKVRWQYNKDENNYIRYQQNDIDKMENGEWIKARNVIVQVNPMKVLDDLGRKRITTTGEGKAWVFRDGQTIEAKWQKDATNKITRYFDNNAKEIELNGGTTWIEVIPNEDYLRY